MAKRIEADWRTIAHLSGAELNGPAAPPDRWQAWSPREETAPELAAPGSGSLWIAGKPHGWSIGSWRWRIEQFRPEAAYRITALCRCESTDPARDLFVRLHWLDENDEPLRPADNAPPPVPVAQQGVRFEYQTVAPAAAAAMVLELGLRWTAGVVCWDEIRLEEAPSLPVRRVKMASVFHRPRNTASPAASVKSFCDIVQSRAPAECDLICLPEAVNLIGTGQNYQQCAEPIPGPATEALGNLARQRNCYIAAALIEKHGPGDGRWEMEDGAPTPTPAPISQLPSSILFNTAVLIGRDGELAGIYRKTHLPQEEADGGLTPGGITGDRPSAAFPVFQTDFGTVGMMICWDVQFPEPARELARAGAEIILLPIWGGSDTLTIARAIENHVFLLSSSYDMRTMIIDPAGRVLCEADGENPICAAEIDLNEQIIQPWLGDMRGRTWTERRELRG